MKRGHSNLHVDDLTQHPVVSDKVLIPMEGGANVSTVKELPPLALSRDEWKKIGDRMNWWLSPAGTNGGTLWIEFHDRGGRVMVEDLTHDGIHNAEFQCTQMLEELEEAKEKLDAEDEAHAPDCSRDCERMPDGKFACATPIGEV